MVWSHWRKVSGRCKDLEPVREQTISRTNDDEQPHMVLDILVNIGSGAKPLLKLKNTYWQLGPWKQMSVEFESKYKSFHSRKCFWKFCL